MSRLLIVAVVFLAACEPPESKHVQDQCLRTVLFQQCLERIPKGPQTSVYNDWAEVVDTCGTEANYQSYRRIEHIKPECRP